MIRPTCFECGKPAQHAHHVVPKSKGGTRTIPLCHDCHALVHDMERMTTAELTKRGLKKAAQEGRTGGRPAALNEQRIERAQKLFRHPDLTKEEAADVLGISKSTLYRYVGPNGSHPA